MENGYPMPEAVKNIVVMNVNEVEKGCFRSRFRLFRSRYDKGRDQEDRRRLCKKQRLL